MRYRAALTAFVFGVSLAAPGHAARTYEGSEAAALRCANTVAYTAVLMESAGLIPREQQQAMLQVTFLILEKHVSGTWAEKKAALAIVRDRRDLDQTLADYQRLAARCLAQFPIN